MGIETGDDAAVLRLGPDVAIVQTLDFFTPLVDDPRDFGRIAAANAVSDVYAMGGKPILALAIVGFPAKQLPLEVGADILAGGAEVCAEAGIPIAGGHSIDDVDVKFGLCVTGVVHPDRILRNSHARAGDWLVLTKPVGSGAMSSAIKAGTLSPELAAAMVENAAFLNRVPAEAAQAVGLRAATDVTGFGLLGHLGAMAKESGLTAELWRAEVPVLPGALDAIAAGRVPGATGRNLAYWAADTDWDPALSDADRKLLADPQTSGGLLLAVPDDKLDALLGELRARGAKAAAVVGRMGPATGKALRVRAARA